MELKKIASYLEASYTEEEIKEVVKKLEALKIQNKEEAELNNIARELEKEGKTGEAIAIYESLLNNNFEGSYPYDRLSIIYKKLKRPGDVIRVLERAVYIFENVVFKERADRVKKLGKYKKDIEKAKSK